MSSGSPLRRVPGLLHGGDYNPEQWPRPVWDEDMTLMTAAHVNTASVGIFSWATLEPEEGRFEFDWLDDLMDLLQRNGRHAALATPSAAAPAWLMQGYPETRKVGADGVRRRHGHRVNFCWTSPIYRDRVRRMNERIAARYAGHPALAFWHVSNEYGGPCHCDLCQAAFQAWLTRKYAGDIERLNHAYWSRFWSHTYSSFDQLEIPVDPHGDTAVMGLTLDWRRFVSDRIIDFMKAEVAPLRAAAPDVPVTTNMMGLYGGIDYQAMAKEVDFISWDSYPCFIDHPINASDWVRVGFVHDLNRSLKRQPFLLIESTPESSNWYPVMSQKRPGAHRIEGWQAIAHGSEGVMYFQWRKSRGAMEQHHGAVVGHDGTDKTRVFSDVAELGRDLENLAPVKGGMPNAEVALIYDWQNAWAIEGTVGPRQQGKNYAGTVIDHYRPLWERGISVDVIASDDDLSGYKVVIAPMLFLMKPGVQDSVRAFVASGGVFVTTYWSFMTDENMLVQLGGFPAGMRDVFGIWVEATDALFPEVEVKCRFVGGEEYLAREYCDLVHAEGAEVVATYTSEFYAGSPSITRNAFGDGQAWFIASRNESKCTDRLVSQIVSDAGIRPVLDVETPPGVTIQRRKNERGEFLFFLNFSQEPCAIDLPTPLLEVDSDTQVDRVQLDPNGVRCLRK